MSDNESWTVLRLLQWTEKFLRDHHSESPRLDAEILLAAARQCQRIDLYMAFNDEATEEVRANFRDLVRRRAAGTPVAYLVGSREFYSRSFTVTPDVLIPRPETEFVLIELLDRAKQQATRDWSIADVGTGSGILAINAALELPAARVAAFDLSPAALDVARQNARTHGVEARLDFYQGDLFEGSSSLPTFDFVVSNPPYVSDSEFDALDAGVRDFEPKMALVAGPNGTSVIERLIPQAAERLRPGGWLIIEISPMIAARVRDLLNAHPSFATPHTVKDLAQLARVITAQRVA